MIGEQESSPLTPRFTSLFLSLSSLLSPSFLPSLGSYLLPSDDDCEGYFPFFLLPLSLPYFFFLSFFCDPSFKVFCEQEYVSYDYLLYNVYDSDHEKLNK